MTRTMGRLAARSSLIAAAAVLTVLAPERGVINGSAFQSSCLVALTDGGVQGLDQGSTCAFLGIRYAASPAGSNRWRPPQPVTPWAPSLFNATVPPTNCPALAQFGPPTISGLEDCLKLNVWVPDPAPVNPAPVIVWLHTGSFIGASANFPGSNGRRLAEETGAIIVAPNYRLGAFGFLVHSALSAEASSGSSGNYGLLDQQAALRWVQNNIAHFGGDPDNVTIAGTSAGGQSVGLQLVSPGSAGLFHRAAIQSAYPTTRWTEAVEATKQGDAFAAALGCTDPAAVLDCMRAKSLEAVVSALPQAAQQIVEPPGRAFWEPVVDGVVIPDQPRLLFESGNFHRVPTIVGFNRDEGWGAFVNRSFPSGVSLAAYENWLMIEFGAAAPAILSLYPADSDPATAVPTPLEAIARVTGDAQFVCEARRLARAIERTGTRTYLYSYEYEIDALAVDHVIHGVEANILFGNSYVAPVFVPYTLGASDLVLHNAMSGYWSRFAATGNPNTDDDTVVRWPAFKHPTAPGRAADKFIVFDTVIREGRRPREGACDFFEPFFLRSLLGAVPAGTP